MYRFKSHASFVFLLTWNISWLVGWHIWCAIGCIYWDTGRLLTRHVFSINIFDQHMPRIQQLHLVHLQIKYCIQISIELTQQILLHRLFVEERQNSMLHIRKASLIEWFDCRIMSLMVKRSVGAGTRRYLGVHWCGSRNRRLTGAGSSEFLGCWLTWTCTCRKWKVSNEIRIVWIAEATNLLHQYKFIIHFVCIYDRKSFFKSDNRINTIFKLPWL